MNENDTPSDILGHDFPGPLARCFLALLIPTGRREEFVGDLIEEAETMVSPRSGQKTAWIFFIVLMANWLYEHRLQRT